MRSVNFFLLTSAVFVSNRKVNKEGAREMKNTGNKYKVLDYLISKVFNIFEPICCHGWLLIGCGSARCDKFLHKSRETFVLFLIAQI